MKQYLNEHWKFGKIPNGKMTKNVLDKEEMPMEYEEVHLPHTWYKDGEAYQGMAVYKKSIRVETVVQKRIFLTFEAADRWCQVFVNRNFAGEHKGGYAAFTFEITDFCKEQQDNEIIVFVDNRSYNEISPLSGDFTVYGGLYRGVYLTVTDEVCFDRTFWGTCGVVVQADVKENEGWVIIDPHVLGKANENIFYQITDPAKNVILECSMPVEKCVLKITDPILWDGMENPSCYHLRAVLRQNEKELDWVERSFGFRKVELSATHGFFLNGKKLKLNGVAKHQDFDGVFCAVTEEHCRKDLDTILDIGANSVRLSHYQHPQSMYDLCDENGLVVWAEIPMLKFLDEKELFENACQQMKELIYQNMHHPSICFWGIQNEIAIFGENEAMYEKMGQLRDLVEELDSTRLSACANLYCVKPESKLNRVTKAVGYNIYFGWYYGDMKDNAKFIEEFHRKNPDVALGITEYGVDCNLAFHSDNPKVKDYSEEYQALYHETVYPIFKKQEYIWGSFIWNLFDFGSAIRDEGGTKYRNCKGLVSYDRNVKKDAFYYYKAQWSKDPFVKIAGSRFINHEQRMITVKVYSNQKEVILRTDGYMQKQLSDTGVFVFEKVPLALGRHKIEAYSKDQNDQVFLCGTTEADASYIYVDCNPGINVKNWFEDAAQEEKLFPTGFYSIRDCGDDLVQNEQVMNVISGFSRKLADQLMERKGKLPLERILSYMKKDFSDEDCRRLNEDLIKIKKN